MQLLWWLKNKIILKHWQCNKPIIHSCSAKISITDIGRPINTYMELIRFSWTTKWWEFTKSPVQKGGQIGYWFHSTWHQLLDNIRIGMNGMTSCWRLNPNLRINWDRIYDNQGNHIQSAVSQKTITNRDENNRGFSQILKGNDEMKLTEKHQ